MLLDPDSVTYFSCTDRRPWKDRYVTKSSTWWITYLSEGCYWDTINSFEKSNQRGSCHYPVHKIVLLRSPIITIPTMQHKNSIYLVTRHGQFEGLLYISVESGAPVQIKERNNKSAPLMGPTCVGYPVPPGYIGGRDTGTDISFYPAVRNGSYQADRS